MCLYPQLIENRRYIKNKKNGGVIPAILDNRVKAVPIGCGNCMECRKQKARDWQIRLTEDVRTNKNGKFVTLTFSNESIKELVETINKKNEYEIKGYEMDNEIATLAVERFRERWRKEYKKSIRHWLITELGHNGTENIHLHGIVWTDESIEQVRKHWKYGYIYPRSKEEVKKNFVSEKSVNYLIKYVHKIDQDHKYYKSKILTSAGIGSNYINREDSKRNIFKGEETEEFYRLRNGRKSALPIYYKNKIYKEEEKEKLWLQKLDKQERWINGNRVDISKGEEEYYKVLEEERRKNAQLGYGNSTIEWDRKKYEEDRRNMLLQKRIEEKESLRGLGIAPESAESVNNSLRSAEWKKEMGWEEEQIIWGINYKETQEEEKWWE